MKVSWIVLIILVPLVKGGLLTSQTNDSVTTEVLVRRQGYPFEKHTVVTEDGYILELHRIPYSARVNTSGPQQVAFIMHGLAGSSSDWIIPEPDSSLAFILSDAGFDVWLGNARGNTYSHKNIKYSSNTSQFWNFSWHEISVIDLPAMFNYIIDLTGIQKLRYFAHSQGTTNYLVLAAVKPEWNDRFISVHLLAPVGFINHATNFFLRIGRPAGLPNPLRELLGSSEFKPSKETALVISKLTCNRTLPQQYQILCDNTLFSMTEFNEDTVKVDYIPDLMATTPSSLSTNQYLHYLQLFDSGFFRQYDYGLARNLIKYRSVSPPDYELNNIRGNVFLYTGPGDKYVSKTDLDRLIEKFPNSALAGLYVVPIQNFDHLAFLFTEDLRTKVNNIVMKDVASIN